MTISVRFLSVVRALRSFQEILLRIGLGLQDMMSFLTALMKATRAASLPTGGVHVPLHLRRFTSSDGLAELVWSFWKNSFSRKRLAKSLISACISDQLIRLGVGTKVSPRDNNLISVFESCAVERLITVSFCSSGGFDELFERVLRFFFFWLVGVSVLLPMLPVFVA